MCFSSSETFTGYDLYWALGRKVSSHFGLLLDLDNLDVREKGGSEQRNALGSE